MILSIWKPWVNGFLLRSVSFYREQELSFDLTAVFCLPQEAA
jgi:hypothetical protein